MTPQIDTVQIRRFFDALFLYADNTGYISLRSFPDSTDGVPEIKSFVISNSDDVLAAAYAMAARCAANPNPMVFCPPIATFNNPNKADEKSLANGLALSVECDQRPAQARKKLESLLGAATLVIESGGKWTNPETGETEAKLHLHWRLAALFHLFEQGSPTGQIGAENIARAAAIVRWHLYEARRFLGEVALPQHTDNAVKLDAWLVSRYRQQGKNEASTTEIMQFGPNTLRRKQTLDEALRVLEGLYRVKIMQSGNSRRIVINPALLTGGVQQYASAKAAIPATARGEQERPIAEIALARTRYAGGYRVRAVDVFKNESPKSSLDDCDVFK